MVYRVKLNPLGWLTHLGWLVFIGYIYFPIY